MEQLLEQMGSYLELIIMVPFVRVYCIAIVNTTLETDVFILCHI